MAPKHIFRWLSAIGERGKALVFVFLIILFFSLAFLYYGVSQHNKTIDLLISKTESDIDITMDLVRNRSLHDDEKSLHTFLAINPEIIRAFEARDRDLLYDLTLPHLRVLKGENKYFSNIHFHLPDGRSFLRVHDKDVYGDDLLNTRPSLKRIHNEKKMISGFELGVHGAYFRVLSPVFSQQHYIGAVEFGQDLHQAVDIVQSILRMPVTTYFLKDTWEKASATSNFNMVWRGIYLINSHGNPIYGKLPPNLPMGRKYHAEVEIDKTHYIVHTHQVFEDFTGKYIGGLIVLQDITDLIDNKGQFLIRTVFLTIFFMFLGVIALQLCFNWLHRKQRVVEKELRQSKEEWERTFDVISDLVTIQDPDMRIVRANKAAEDFFEVEHENLQKTFHISSSSLSDGDGSKELRVHIARDITDQKQLEEELFQSRKMESIGTLAGGIAHDFNNILGAIIGFSEFIRDDLAEDSPSRDDIDHILHSADRAKHLVSQILSFSRKGEHQFQILEPYPVVKEALGMLHSTLPSTVTMEKEIAENVGMIKADPINIHQILVNLCTNGCQAMEGEKGILHITLRQQEVRERYFSQRDVKPGKFVVLMVSDTGCGMDEDTRERIFEPFFTTKEVGKGTGMGLAVLHGIVKEHGGFVELETSPGEGSTFRVYFPVVETVST